MNVTIAHGGDLSVPKGGHERVVAFAAGLAEAGHEVTVVAPEPAGSLPEDLDPVTVHPVATADRGRLHQPVRGIRVARTAKRVHRRAGGTLQVEHSTLGGLCSLVGCDGYVLDMHDLAHSSFLYGDLPLGRAIDAAIRRIERQAVRDAGTVVVVSGAMRDVLVDRWDVAPERVAVVTNGYDRAAFGDLRWEPDPTGPARVAFLGTLHPKIDADAIAAIARSPQVDEVVVVGDGPDRGSIRRVADRLPAGAVTLRGRLPIREALATVADATVAINPQRGSPSQRVSSPVKVRYYAALGVPMVLSRGPEVAGELAAAGGAVLVDGDEPFDRVVEAVLADPDRRTSLSENALAAAEGWSWERRTGELCSLYASRVDPGGTDATEGDGEDSFGE